MEQNRNVDFDSDVEIDSLKDAVWRLTTRVYLLEDFIAERFGEVIGPSGFTRSKTSPFPGTSRTQNISSTIGGSVSQNTPSSFSGNKKGRKRDHDHVGSSGMEGHSNKIQKNTAKNEVISAPDEDIDTQRLDLEESENYSFLIPKLEDELLHGNSNDWEANDYFLDEKSDGDEDLNDSVEKDPDFDPLTCPAPAKDRTRKMQDKTEPVPQSFIMSVSRNGTDLVVDMDKNTYGIHKRGKGGTGKRIWRCNRTGDDGKKCKGRCYTIGDQMFMITPHAHSENDKVFKCREIKLKIKEMAITTALPKKDIIDTVLEGVDEAVKAKLPTKKTLYSLVQKAREKADKNENSSAPTDTETLTDRI